MHGQSYYKLNGTEVTFWEAEQSCERDGARLGMAKDQESHNALTNIMSKLKEETFFFRILGVLLARIWRQWWFRNPFKIFFFALLISSYEPKTVLVWFGQPFADQRSPVRLQLSPGPEIGVDWWLGESWPDVRRSRLRREWAGQIILLEERDGNDSQRLYLSIPLCFSLPDGLQPSPRFGTGMKWD